jgi:hypothetical protein
MYMQVEAIAEDNSKSASEDDQELLLLLNVARTGGAIACTNHDCVQHCTQYTLHVRRQLIACSDAWHATIVQVVLTLFCIFAGPLAQATTCHASVKLPVTVDTPAYITHHS